MASRLLFDFAATSILDTIERLLRTLNKDDVFNVHPQFQISLIRMKPIGLLLIKTPIQKLILLRHGI